MQTMRTRGWLAGACLCLLAAPTHAALFCATTSAQFQSALDAAAVNGEHDEIRLATGIYAAPSSGFNYNAAAPIDGDSLDLSITGGWIEFLGNPCGQQPKKDPSLTAIDGNGIERGLVLHLRQGGDVGIRLLTFIDGHAPTIVRGGGLAIHPSNPYDGSIDIERNHFVDNEAHSAGALEIYYENGSNAQTRIVSNLFVANHARALTGTVSVVVNQPANSTEGERGLTTDPAISFINNTVVNNTTGDSSEFAVGGVWINGSVPAKWVVNNNFWNNDGADIRVISPEGFRLWNNNVEHRIGDTPEFMENNLSATPAYKECGVFCVHREPLLDTPLIDAGTEPPPFSAPWSISATDAAGHERVNGPGVDIGAYENQSRLFVDRFEQ